MNPLRPAALTLVSSLIVASSLALATSLAAADYKVPQRDLGFPVYKNSPPGKQLVGDTVRAAASDPARHPDETRQLLQVPPGFEVCLFASEPEVVNPVAMTWDERGRLWVLELYEYPRGAKPGTKGRDRIKILEDTDGDGIADKVTVFADGFDLATGLALGNGGVYLGAAPNFYFLEDTNAVANGGVLTKANKITILKTGFGLEDRHELLNGFAWGPDGWLYMTHGVFTHSKVKDPGNPDDPGVKVDAALARFHPRTKNSRSSPTARAIRGASIGTSAATPLSARASSSISFTWRPAASTTVRAAPGPTLTATCRTCPPRASRRRGLAALPRRARRHLHLSRRPIPTRMARPRLPRQHPSKRPQLRPPHARRRDLHGAEGNQTPRRRPGHPGRGRGQFPRQQRPVVPPLSVQTGPDGALWIADWCDKYPCYQNAQADPEGVDREHGRIWRVVWVGNEKGKKVASRPEVNMDLANRTNKLEKLIEHPNSWQRRTAQRLLTERSQEPQSRGEHRDEIDSLNLVVENGKVPETQLAALSALSELPYLKNDPKEKFVVVFSAAREPLLSSFAYQRSEPYLRAWVAKLIGNQNRTGDDYSHSYGVHPVVKPEQETEAKLLLHLAADPDTSVRASVAVALRQSTSSSLTVNTRNHLLG